MNEKEAFDRFTTFETDHSMFSRSYNSVYYWDRIRCEVFSAIAEKAGIWSTNRYAIESQDVEGSLILTGVTQAIDSFRTLPDSPLFTDERDVLFAAATTSRRECLNSTYWDVVVDPLADKIDFSYTSLENKSEIRRQCDGNIRTQDTTATDQLQFISNLGVTIKRESIQGREAEKIRFLENEIRRIFSVDINLIERVKKELTRRKYTKPIYERIIKKIDPEATLIRYNPGRSTLIEVCKKFGVPVIELQHGVDFDHSPSISYDTPIEGEVCFPDAYFSWGEYWCNKPNFPIDDIRVVGWPFLEFVSENYSSREKGEKILFISQPGCGEKLSKIAVEIAENPDWDVIYRLHPKERPRWKSIYPWLESQSICVDSGDRALYEVMTDCWAQIGTESTALYEGLKFDLSTFIFNDFDPETHPWNEIDSIPVFSNSGELDRYLRQQSTPDVDSEMFFKSNSIENIQQEITSIISQ